MLGKRNSQDAYHIYTAEKEGLYCFLTMDFKLLKNIKSQVNNKIIKSLKTKILSPEDLGNELGLLPITLRAFSYHDASYPVREDLNWENSKRRGGNIKPTKK